MLPNRVSVNLFAGSLIINIITIGYTTRVPSFSFTGFTLVINLAEIVNPCLQLVIFSLLTMVVLIFVFYLLLVFTFYIFTSQGDRTYRRVRYNDPAVDNLLEIVSNEL